MVHFSTSCTKVKKWHKITSSMFFHRNFGVNKRVTDPFPAYGCLFLLDIKTYAKVFQWIAWYWLHLINIRLQFYLNTYFVFGCYWLRLLTFKDTERVIHMDKQQIKLCEIYNSLIMECQFNLLLPDWRVLFQEIDWKIELVISVRGFEFSIYI